MSLVVIKAGVADTVQDNGRYGYQQLGINPSGAMDLNAMKIANVLVGNDPNSEVLELSFPASSFEFSKPALIALSGGDFSAKLDGTNIPLNIPCMVPAGSKLKFSKGVNGMRCYLAVYGGFSIVTWLDSTSTNTRAKVGGIDGRSLKKDDVLNFNTTLTKTNGLTILPWRANVAEFYPDNYTIRCIQGNEFEWLTKKSQRDFQKEKFTISSQSDRMGYRLNGITLKQSKKNELLSTAVGFGTVQLLPDGDLIVLMADHQTTGGYPRVAQILSADRSQLAQCRPNQKISFQMVSLEDAEALAFKQQQSLNQLQAACRSKLNDFLKSTTA